MSEKVLLKNILILNFQMIGIKWTCTTEDVGLKTHCLKTVQYKKILSALLKYGVSASAKIRQKCQDIIPGRLMKFLGHCLNGKL